MSDESLLDVFVNVGTKGMEEVEQEIKSFVERAKKAFSGAATIDVKTSSKSWADIGEIEDAKKAIEGLRQEVLKFGIDKDKISIGVRLLGSTDVSRQLSDIQSKVNAAKKEFALSEPGEAGNADRADAIARITALREADLATLQKQVEAELQLKGLDTVYANRAAAIRGASEQAEKFALELKDLNSIVQKSGNTGLREEFNAISKSAAEIKLNLKSALSAGDLVSTENAVADLNTLKQQFDALRRSAANKILINADIDNVVEGFDEIKKRFASANRLLSFETRGSLGVEQKVAVANIEKEMRDLVITFDILAKKMDKTADDFVKMKQLAENFNQAAVSIGEIKDKALAAGASTNSLSNNAYQLGQAFEDAAVGFSLNGLTGAVRGAANNVNFLVNNLAQAGSLTGILGARAASLAPLYLGVGTAALFIIPALYEWLQTLGEIEDKTKDLSDDMRQNLSDIQFKVSLIIDAQEAEKAVREAEDSSKAIEEVIKQANEGKKLAFKLSTELELISARKITDDFDAQLKSLAPVIGQRLRDVSRDLFVPRGAEGDVDIIPADPEDIQRVQNLENALNTLNVARKQLFDNAKNDIVDPGPIETARDSLRFLIDGFEELIGTGDLTAAEMKNVKASLEEAQQQFEKFNEEAQKIDQIQGSLLGPVLDAAVESSKKLSREYQFQADINSGRVDEEDRILFLMQEQEIALKRQNDELLKIFGNTQKVRDIEVATEAVLQEQQRIDLTKEIREIEKEIAAERKDAAKDAESAAERRSSIEERIAEAQQDGIDRVSDAQLALQDERASQAQNAQEKAIQDQIDLLQKAESGLKSTKSSLGDTGQTVFGAGGGNAERIKQLQEQLKVLRDAERVTRDAQRIRELQERIVSAREEAQKKIEELQKDLQGAREEEIEAVNAAAEEINKLTDQMKKLGEALIDNAAGKDTKIPGQDFAPEDAVAPDWLNIFSPKEMNIAQANANERAMESTDFTSSSLESLLSATNSLLDAMGKGIMTLDTSSRYS